jgi:uncharacterized protein (DUF1778 family)
MYSVSTTIQSRSSKPRRLVSARVNLRISPEVKAALMQAAKLQRIKLTEFMVNASQTAAETTMADRTLFILPAEKWREFNAALDAPAREIPALRKLFTKRPVFKAA